MREITNHQLINVAVILLITGLYITSMPAFLVMVIIKCSTISIINHFKILVINCFKTKYPEQETDQDINRKIKYISKNKCLSKRQEESIKHPIYQYPALNKDVNEMERVEAVQETNQDNNEDHLITEPIWEDKNEDYPIVEAAQETNQDNNEDYSIVVSGSFKFTNRNIV